MQPYTEKRLRRVISDAPTYMEMEDLARALDAFRLDPWMVKTISGMRSTLNDIAYWLKKDEDVILPEPRPVDAAPEPPTGQSTLDLMEALRASLAQHPKGGK